MKSRRGLSSVVGMVFSIIALTTVVTYVSYSMNTLDQYNQAVLNKNQQTVDIGNEKFQVISANIVNNKFNITVINTGNLPINFTKIWAQNTTAMSQNIDWTKSYVPKNSFVAPGQTLKNIGQNIPLYFASTSPSYHFKLVTSRGNIQEFNVNSGGSQKLFMRLDAIPNVVAPGNTVTLIYTVTNNMSSNSYLLNVQPLSQLTTSTTGTGTFTYVSGPIPSNVVNLQPGSTTSFKYTYTVSGTDTDTITFTDQLQNGLAGNVASDTVTIQNVLFASQSKTSVSTQGLGSLSTNNILVLHDQTVNTPGGAYQMYSGNADSSGTSVSLTANSKATAMFYTAPNSAATTIVPSGKWNIVFRYNSVAMPTANLRNNPPDVIYYFGNGNQLKDSSGNADDLTQNNNPTYSASCTRDSSGCYTFASASSQYLTASDKSYNNIAGNKAAVAGWFKWSGTLPATNKDGTIIDIDGGSQSDFFKVAVQHSGKLRFAFSTANDGLTGNNAAKCDSAASTYGDGNWHFFVAIRDAASGNNNQCKLYVDNAAAVTATANPGTNQVDNGGNGIYIGRNATGTGTSYFSGSIDYIMYWNNFQLSPGDISTLYTRNYGTAAHVISVNMTKTDTNGNIIKQLNSSKPWSLPFVDTAFNVPPIYGKINYTIPNLSNASDASGKWYFDPNERLRLNVTSNVASASLNMTWRINDRAEVDIYPGYGSFIQLPTPTPSFLSYYTYKISSGSVQYTEINGGPNGVWLQTGTRIVFQSTTGGTSYAGIITAVNGTTNFNVGYMSASNPIQDSLYIPVNQRALINFSQPNSIPHSIINNPPSVGRIVAGTYTVYVTTIGYDDAGNNVLKTTTLGTVTVVP